MPSKLQIAIVGPGRLGSALAISLQQAGYRVGEVVSRGSARSRRKAAKLASKVGARATAIGQALLSADVVWLCVPDREIGPCARLLARARDWRGKIALHCSGALSSDELQALRRRGAAVAAVHPMMTFVSGVTPSLAGVPFAMEGDALAFRSAKRMVRALKGDPFRIRKANKAAYHAWGAFTSPLLIAALVTGESVAERAGIPRTRARKMLLPIVRQTLSNYVERGPANAFSGPLVRGDTATLRRHLQVLRKTPAAREVYLALARAALRSLPVRNRKQLRNLLQNS